MLIQPSVTTRTARLAPATPALKAVTEALGPEPQMTPMVELYSRNENLSASALTLGAGGVAGLAAWASGLAPQTAGIVGAVGAVVGLVASGLLNAKASQQRGQHQAWEKSTDFVCGKVQEANLSDATPVQFPGGVALAKDKNLLIQFAANKDVFVATGTGEKDKVIYLPESEARAGSPGGDFLRDHNGSIPVSAYTNFSCDGEIIGQNSGKRVSVLFNAESGQLVLGNEGAHIPQKAIYGLADKSIDFRGVECGQGMRMGEFTHEPMSYTTYSESRFQSKDGEVSLYRNRPVGFYFDGNPGLPIRPEVFGRLHGSAPLTGPLADRTEMAQAASRVTEEVSGLRTTDSYDLKQVKARAAADANLENLQSRTQDADLKEVIRQGRKLELQFETLDTLSEAREGQNLRQLLASLAVKAGGSAPLMKELAKVEPKVAQTLEYLGKNPEVELASPGLAKAFSEASFEPLQSLAQGAATSAHRATWGGERPGLYKYGGGPEFAQSVLKASQDPTDRGLAELVLSYEPKDVRCKLGAYALSRTLSTPIVEPRQKILTMYRNAESINRALDGHSGAGAARYFEMADLSGKLIAALVPHLDDHPDLKAKALEAPSRNDYAKAALIEELSKAFPG